MNTDKLMGVLLAISSLLELKDPYTEGHCSRVKVMVAMLCHRLGISGESLNECVTAATLHDIGKVGVPGSILRKTGKLTADEFDAVKKHPEVGADAIEKIEGYQNVARLIRHHHEHYDGRGYPDGLAGNAIPIGARVISVVDAFDAMTFDRAYRNAMSVEKAIEIIKAERNRQFDPEIADAFILVVNEKEVGMIDPVCGMEGNEEISLLHSSRRFYFCSKTCMDAFTRDSRRYYNLLYGRIHGDNDR